MTEPMKDDTRLREAVAMTLKGINTNTWDRLDPASRVMLSRDAAQFIGAVRLVIADAFHELADLEEQQK